MRTSHERIHTIEKTTHREPLPVKTTLFSLEGTQSTQEELKNEPPAKKPSQSDFGQNHYKFSSFGSNSPPKDRKIRLSRIWQ